MKIGILSNPKSYLPEITAYKKYLISRNFKVLISDKEQNLRQCQWIITFPGFFLRKNLNVKYIHDYASASTPPFSFLKDKLKINFNFKPNFRLFNSLDLKNYYNFKDNISFAIRTAGVDSFFFKNKKKKKKYDILYSGSYRINLEKVLIKLLKLEFSILVLGKFKKDFINYFNNYNNINFKFIKNRRLLPSYYQQCEYGLNYMPNIPPFNNQNSLKLLEYCASNLKILSSDYLFVRKFEKIHHGKFLFIDNINKKEEIIHFNFITPNVKNYSWEKILDKIKFDKIFNKRV